MLLQPVFCYLHKFGARLAIVAPGIDADSSAGCEFSPYFDVPGIHQFDQILHDDVDAVFMEAAMVAKTEEVQFQTFALNHFDVRDVGDINRGEIRLTGYRTQ